MFKAIETSSSIIVIFVKLSFLGKIFLANRLDKLEAIRNIKLCLFITKVKPVYNGALLSFRLIAEGKSRLVIKI